MKKKSVIVSALITTLILPVTNAFAYTQANTFSDLSSLDSQTSTAILDVAKIGWMSGDTDGEFRPLAPITRREIAVIITKVLNLQVQNVKFLSYTDVSPNDWGLKYIETVRKAGIMKGSGDHFRPNDLITHEEFTVILAKLAHLQISNTKTISVLDQNIPFQDKNLIQNWAKPYVEAATTSGLIDSKQLKFFPQQHATREEIAVILENLAKYIGDYKLYSGTWSAIVSNQKFNFVIDNTGSPSNISLYNGDPNKVKPYFTIPVTFVSGSATFDTNDYNGTVQLKDNSVILDLNSKSTNSITFFGGKHLYLNLSQLK